MKVMIDTNVAMDFLSDITPYSDDAEKVFTLCCSELVDGFMTVNSFCDLHYILRKCLHNEDDTRDVLGFWTRCVGILDTTSSDCINALDSENRDYEDAVIIQAARRCGFNYIVTRNVDYFCDSPVPAVTPSEFISIALKADFK